jgi:hypothetical protein
MMLYKKRGRGGELRALGVAPSREWLCVSHKAGMQVEVGPVLSLRLLRDYGIYHAMMGHGTDEREVCV